MANAKVKKLQGTFKFDSDKKNTKQFRPEADKEGQLSNAVYVRKDKLETLEGFTGSETLKITIEVA